MDNDYKIKLNKDEDNLHDEVMLFLGDEVNRIHQDVTNNSYNIEKEYEKTKKNHSPYNFLVLFGAFLVVIGIVFFVNKYITLKDQEISVSLDEFEDLNLNNLLNTVATAQINYDSALKEKLILETEYETKLNDLKSDMDNEIFVLDSLNLSNRREYNRRKAKIQSFYDEGVKALKEEYEGQILLAEKQVEAYKARLDEFDSVKVANAQEKEKLINSERQLKQLEIEKLTKSYEARIANMELAMRNMKSDSSTDMRSAVHDVATRYQAEIDTLDPKLNDAKANEIIGSLKETVDFDGVAQLTEARVHEEKIIESVNIYQDMYNNYKYLDDVVKSIPQKHSIPSYVAASRNLVNNMSKIYLDSSVAYYQDIMAKRLEIDKLNDFIEEQQLDYENKLAGTKNACDDYLAAIFRSLKTDGIIINVDSNNNIMVAVNPDVMGSITNAGVAASVNVAISSGEEGDAENEGGVSEIAIRGKIVPDVSGTFYFEIDKDGDGNPIPVGPSVLTPGTEVKIIR